MAVETLLARLDHIRKTGRAQWVACCPAHDDHGPSLSIAETADGRVLMHCFAGCSPLAVLEALGLTFADLFPERDPDDVGRRAGWRTAGHRDSRQQQSHISARTALVAVAHDATEVAVLIADVADGRVQADAVRMRLWELAGNIASTLRVTGVDRG